MMRGPALPQALAMARRPTMAGGGQPTDYAHVRGKQGTQSGIASERAVNPMTMSDLYLLKSFADDPSPFDKPADQQPTDRASGIGQMTHWQPQGAPPMSFMPGGVEEPEFELPESPMGGWPYNRTGVTPWDPLHMRQSVGKYFASDDPDVHRIGDKLFMMGMPLESLGLGPATGLLRLLAAAPTYSTETSELPDMLTHMAGEQVKNPLVGGKKEKGEEGKGKPESKKGKPEPAKRKPTSARGGAIKRAMAVAKRPRKTARRRK